MGGGLDTTHPPHPGNNGTHNFPTARLKSNRPALQSTPAPLHPQLAPQRNRRLAAAAGRRNGERAMHALQAALVRPQPPRRRLHPAAGCCGCRGCAALCTAANAQGAVQHAHTHTHSNQGPRRFLPNTTLFATSAAPSLLQAGGRAAARLGSLPQCFCHLPLLPEAQALPQHDDSTVATAPQSQPGAAPAAPQYRCCRRHLLRACACTHAGAPARPVTPAASCCCQHA